MNRLRLTGLIICFLLFYACLVEGQQSKPNIIFILTDDQAPWAFGASGNVNASTPNMDKLARQGAFLKNAFATTPVCSPSRASIMTSRYASEYMILDFIPHPGHRLYDPSYTPGLDPESVTFAEVLQQSGYTTALVGKWHLGDWSQTEDKKFHPTNHGYDYFMGLTGGGTDPDDPELEKEGKVQKFKGLTTDILTDHAIAFLEKNAGHPFLLCLNTRAPHAKWLPVAEEDWAPYEEMDPIIPNPAYPDLDVEKVKRKMREYLASTSGMDRNLGRVVHALERLGLSRNTVIIFYSDHGYNMGHNGIEHKGNGKWITRQAHADSEYIKENFRPNLYDNSLKVPAFVYWPSKIQPGTVIDHTISCLDLFPTIVAIAGACLPEDHLVRGRSFLPLLEGEDLKDWNDDFYGEYSMINYSQAYLRCYRTPEWKLVRDFLNPERDELYHIAIDPEENINLIQCPDQETREVTEKLHARIIQSMEETKDPLLDRIRRNQDMLEYYR